MPVVAQGVLENDVIPKANPFSEKGTPPPKPTFRVFLGFRFEGLTSSLHCSSFFGSPVLWLGSYNRGFGQPKKGTTMETLGRRYLAILWAPKVYTTLLLDL